LASDYPPVAVGRLREVAARLAELRYGGGEAGRWLLNLVAESWIGSPCTRPAARWSRDRPFKSPPDESHEKLDELMFGLLKCGPAPAQRAVERALGDCRQVVPKIRSFDGPSKSA
jgi:hypothetical protein